jgi:glycosyltransferase involved in cell wall biosynthesis
MQQAKRIWVATPYGKDGMGGIDRLNDAILDAVNARPELGLECTRLITRGKRGLVAAQCIFGYALARFCTAALRGKVDLLHIHLSIRGSSYRKTVLGMAARALRVPYIVHLHGIEFREFWSNANALVRIGLEHLHAGSACVIVLGRYWAEVILERLPNLEPRIIVLPNATLPAPPSARASEIKGGRVRITFLGQLGARKGTPQLIGALSRLAHLQNWSATVAGDGAVAETRAHAQREGIGERIEIPGWLETAARTKLLQETDILVLPSFAENLPMVIIEAFAHGVAVISTPVGAIPEVVISERTGLLVSPGDVEALAHAIERVITDSELRRALGDAARQAHAESYQLDLYVRRLAEIWQAASAGPAISSTMTDAADPRAAI